MHGVTMKITMKIKKNATCILQVSPKGQKQQVPMQWWYTYIKPHVVTCLTLTAMRTSNLTHVLVYHLHHKHLILLC